MPSHSLHLSLSLIFDLVINRYMQSTGGSHSCSHFTHDYEREKGRARFIIWRAFSSAVWLAFIRRQNRPCVSKDEKRKEKTKLRSVYRYWSINSAASFPVRKSPMSIQRGISSVPPVFSSSSKALEYDYIWLIWYRNLKAEIGEWARERERERSNGVHIKCIRWGDTLSLRSRTRQIARGADSISHDWYK